MTSFHYSVWIFADLELKLRVIADLEKEKGIIGLKGS
jgi:hypothetical protein